MPDYPSSEGEAAPIEIFIEDDAWNKLGFDANNICLKAAKAALGEFEQSNETIAIQLNNNAALRALNLEWRNIDKATNVLSFPNINGSGHLGDIAIALEYITKEAIEQSKTLENHLSHMVIHGILHCLGYDHEEDDEAQEMEDLERLILNKLSISDPYEWSKD